MGGELARELDGDRISLGMALGRQREQARQARDGAGLPKESAAGGVELDQRAQDAQAVVHYDATAPAAAALGAAAAAAAAAARRCAGRRVLLSALSFDNVEQLVKGALEAEQILHAGVSLAQPRKQQQHLVAHDLATVHEQIQIRAIRGTQRHSEALRGIQRPSKALGGAPVLDETHQPADARRLV